MVPTQTRPRADVGQTLGSVLLIVYLFLLFSRLPEFISLMAGRSVYLLLIVGSVSFLLVLFNGSFLRALRSRQGIYLGCFTCWLLLATPLSFWRGGSVRLLAQVWSKSLVSFLVVAAIIATVVQCKRAMYALALGTVFVEIATYFLGAEEMGRLDLGGGSFRNANALAFHAIVGFPFLFLLLLQGKALYRLLAAAGLVYGVMVVLRTGSRSAAIEMALLMLFFFLRLPLNQKIAFTVAAPLVLLVGLSRISGDALDRYGTLFNADENSAASQSAMDSGKAREALLMDSLALTFQHPVFGVGPGVFTAVSAEEAEKEGRPARWRDTHNAYTQISSECGLPALFFYMAAFGVSLTSMLFLYRTTRSRPQTKVLADMAYCLLLALVAFAVNAVFDSNGYLYYFPTLAALSVGLYAASRESVQASGFVHKTPASIPALAPATVSVGPQWNPSSPKLLRRR